jgi:ABC-type antimicrobial peptide transport system permease subunit
MRPSDLIAQTIRSTRARPLESGLIVIAVALGVSVVTAMLALVLNGLEQERTLIQSVEARELVMTAKTDDRRGFFSSTGVNPVLKVGGTNDQPVQLEKTDLQAALKACPSLQSAFLAYQDAIKEGKTNKDTSLASEVHLLAVTQPYIEAARLNLLAGAWPNSNDFLEHKRVIAVTERFARERFGRAKPKINDLGQPFTLQSVIGKALYTQNGREYMIVAVFATPQQVTSNLDFQFVNEHQSVGSMGIMTWGIGEFAIPYIEDLQFIAKEDQFDAAREQLVAYASKRFSSSVVVSAARDQMAASLSTTKNAALITLLFASGGLLIAALNITNLMLARVLGRTRGIGISSALGASSRMIFGLFLTESLLLGLLGGLLGLVLARGITAGLEALLSTAAGMDLTLQPLHLVFGFCLALIISLFFGAYPAWMASRVRPSEALRG